MPIPIAIAAAGAQAGGNLLNTGLQAIQNKSNRRWQEKMYQWQRNAALTDWQMQNEYNTPAAQMQRLKDAGLNPHLVYGNGVQASNSDMPRGATPGSPAQDAPQFDTGSVLGAYLNTSINQAQTDNLKAQKTVTEMEAILKGAQTLQTLMSTDKTKFDLELNQELRQTTIDAAKSNLQKLAADIDKTKADTQYTLDQNMRQAQLQPATIQKVQQEIINMQKQNELTSEQMKEIQERINNMVKDGRLKDIEINLRKQGINPNDPTWQKKVWEEIFNPIIKGIKGLKGAKLEPRPTPKSLREWADRLSPY